MKKNRKIVKHFFAILYCLAMAIPLFSVVYYQIDGLGDYTKFQEDNSNGNSQYEDLPQTYYEKVQYQTNELSNVDDLVVGNVYKINAVNESQNTWSSLIQTNYNDNLIIVSYSIDTESPIELSDWTEPMLYNSTFNNVILSFDLIGDCVYLNYFNNENNYINLEYYIESDENLSYFQFICNNNFYNYCLTHFNEIESFLSIADLSECVPTYIEKTTEKKQYYFDDAFGKSYLDFAYGGSQSYSQYYNYVEGVNYNTVYSSFTENQDDEYTEMLINYDFLNLMGVNGVFQNHRGAWYLWLNFYINYLLNMAMIIFMPEVLMIFIQWVRDLIYSFTDKTEGS